MSGTIQEILTPPLTTPARMAGRQRSVETRLDAIERMLYFRGQGQYVTSLPANPVDGQEVSYLVDATLGIVWRLKYRAASASSFKWEFIGGSPMKAGNGAVQSTAFNTFQTTGTPSITVPLAGDYDIEWGCPVAYNTAAAVNQLELGLHIDGIIWLTAYVIASGQWDGNTLHEKNTFASLPARSVLNPRYRSQSSQTSTWQGFYVYTIPTRVG